MPLMERVPVTPRSRVVSRCRATTAMERGNKPCAPNAPRCTNNRPGSVVQHPSLPTNAAPCPGGLSVPWESASTVVVHARCRGNTLVPPAMDQIRMSRIVRQDSLLPLWVVIQHVAPGGSVYITQPLSKSCSCKVWNFRLNVRCVKNVPPSKRSRQGLSCRAISK